MKILFYKLVILIFSLLCPIKKKKLLFLSYYGNQYGCNPKYLSEYLTQHYQGQFDIVWAFVNPTAHKLNKVRIVKYFSLRYFYELCTCKVLITNYRMPIPYRKRKNQIYIQTWHSSLRLKTIEKDAESSLTETYIRMARQDSQYIDYLISGCRFSTNIFTSAFWFDGQILEVGTPRNDLFFQDNSKIKQKACQKYQVEPTTKLLLYAPTFRLNNDLSVYRLDFANIQERLQQKFGGDWKIMVRLHPHLLPYAKELFEGVDVIDATAYDDIQELLVSADVLITDYSSLMFDFTFTRRPCFLYIPDFEEYTRHERKLYFNIKELPFVKTYNPKDLLEQIDLWDDTTYQKELNVFLTTIGSFETGEASKKITELLISQTK